MTKTGVKKKKDVQKNRVPEDIKAKAALVAVEFIDQELAIQRSIYELPIPDPNEKDYFKTLQWRANTLRYNWSAILSQIKVTAGYVHPSYANTKEEKSVADKLISKAEKKVGALVGDVSKVVVKQGYLEGAKLPKDRDKK